MPSFNFSRHARDKQNTLNMRGKESVPLRLADGSGRDGYIFMNNGGFVNPSYVDAVPFEK